MLLHKIEKVFVLVGIVGPEAHTSNKPVD